jgi:2-polyprenyl-3-methyl-5-hydroxy-6-metoxy-1,4-benzoquinol methylase
MANYVWDHDLSGEADRLALMSDLLDPSSRFHLGRLGVAKGWTCLEVGAGNGSLSRWLAEQVGPDGHVLATDLRTDLMAGLGGPNIDVRRLDVVQDEPPGAPFDLVAARALLHHLPERREVVGRMVRWLKPGGHLFIQEPDFYPTWTVRPPSQHRFWELFLAWAAQQRIDYYVGRAVPGWLQAEGMLDIAAEGHAILYQGGSAFAAWWTAGIREIAGRLEAEGGVPGALLEEFYALYRDPSYWTTTISFTATTGRRAPAA